MNYEQTRLLPPGYDLRNKNHDRSCRHTQLTRYGSRGDQHAVGGAGGRPARSVLRAFAFARMRQSQSVNLRSTPTIGASSRPHAAGHRTYIPRHACMTSHAKLRGISEHKSAHSSTDTITSAHSQSRSSPVRSPHSLTQLIACAHARLFLRGFGVKTNEVRFLACVPQGLCSLLVLYWFLLLTVRNSTNSTTVTAGVDLRRSTSYLRLRLYFTHDTPEKGSAASSSLPASNTCA